MSAGLGRATAVVITLGALGFAYREGLRSLRRRGLAGDARWRRSAAAFGAGLLALGVALLPPLDAAAEGSFTAHMGQHLVLALVAAPLLALGAPRVPLIRAAVPGNVARPVARWASRGPGRSIGAVTRSPLLAWAAFGAVLWAWHAPGPYEAALDNGAVHVLEHATMTGAALLAWSSLVRPLRLGRMHPGMGILAVALTGLHCGALGALLAFTGRPWYEGTSLHDQQVAGLLMWVVASPVFLGVVLLLAASWLHDDVPAEAPAAAVVA
jgi:cytochrome c oxidase assembly factor CtaG